jgi:predicted membrane-bound spermidine synthase
MSELTSLQDKANGETFLEAPVLRMRWYFVFFLVSGFCSLVYEVVWLRLAMAEFGVTTAMVSIVIAMFMAGLGLGSWGSGIFLRRLKGNAASIGLRLYAAAELSIGISALLVPLMFRWGHSLLLATRQSAVWQSSQYYLIAGAWVAVTLIPWCTCMGATFPLLMTVIRASEEPGSERSFSYLYIANVLGALLGTLISAFFLIELLGFRGTLRVACTFNALLAFSAFVISLVQFRSRESRASAPDRQIQLELGLFSKSLVLWMLFTTGLVSMGMEVVWIRQFTPFLGNVVYAFASILAIYLLSTLWGSRDYRSWVQSQSLGDSSKAWALLGLSSLLPLVTADPRLPIPDGGLVFGIGRAAAIFPFCALVGFLTPMLVDYWSGGNADRAGKAYAANVLGSILGPLLAGFGLLPRIGEGSALVALSLPLFALGLITVVQTSKSRASEGRSQLIPSLGYGVAVVLAAALAMFTHDYQNVFAQREVRRDYTATVIATGEGMHKRLLVNGTGMTSLTPLTKYMAHLPLAELGRPPANGLVICFGMGTTFRSMLSWGIPTTAVDLVPSVPELFSYFHSDAPRVMNSGLAHVVVDDGRRFLDGTPSTYDVIVVDPPPPTEAAGSSLLYSKEFYSIIREHLSHDGIVQIWYPASVGDAATNVSVAKAINESFPFVRAFKSFDGYGTHYLASIRPIPFISAASLATALPKAAADDFVEWGPATTAEGQFEQVLANELSMNAIVGTSAVPAIQDERPVNEYYMLRRLFPGRTQ